MGDIIQGNGLDPIDSYPLNFYSISYDDQKIARSKLKTVYDNAQAKLPVIANEMSQADQMRINCLANCDAKYKADMDHCASFTSSDSTVQENYFGLCSNNAQLYDGLCRKECTYYASLITQCQANINMINVDNARIINRYYALKEMMSSN